jgi:hypothetical protein
VKWSGVASGVASGLVRAMAEAVAEPVVVPPEGTGAEAGAGEEEDAVAAEEECAAEFQPVIQLSEVEVLSGEEGWTVLKEFRAKMYRYVDDEWKERGIGDLKFLRNDESKKIRILMRRDKVQKIAANHYLYEGMKLQPHACNDKTWIYSAHDFSEEEGRDEQLCVRFPKAEQATEFKEEFDRAVEEMTELRKKEAAAGGGTPAPVVGKKDDGGDDAAEALEKLNVKKDDGEGEAKEAVAAETVA